MGKLREAAEAIYRERLMDDTGTKIGRLIREHPEDRDDILDLLIGEPRIANRKVAEVLNAEYEPEHRIGFADVNHWRNTHGHKYEVDG